MHKFIYLYTKQMYIVAVNQIKQGQKQHAKFDTYPMVNPKNYATDI